MTVPGAMQMMLRRNFGGNEIAAGFFRHLERRSDADRVCMVLELLEEFSPGILDLKPRGRRARKEACGSVGVDPQMRSDQRQLVGRSQC